MKTFLKIAVLVLAIVSLHLLLVYTGFFDGIKDALENFKRVDIFLLAMSVGCAFAFPLSFCYIFAGMAFPLWIAWSICVVGLFFSSGLGFVLGRFVLPRNFLEGLKIKFKLCDGKNSSRNFFNVNFFVRAVPGIPYWIQNVLLAWLGTPYWLYTLVNMCVQSVIALAMTALGASLKQSDTSKFLLFLGVALAMAILYKVLSGIFPCQNPKI